MKRTFRATAIIAGLIERSHQGRRKTGRQATFSTDILYDTLRRYDPDHLLLQITREETMRGLIDFSRIEAMLARVGPRIDLKRLSRVTPLAAPLFFEPGRIPVQGEGRDRLATAQAQALMEAAGLA
jgi:ATP-dependent Lhr-like helicase